MRTVATLVCHFVLETLIQCSLVPRLSLQATKAVQRPGNEARSSAHRQVSKCSYRKYGSSTLRELQLNFTRGSGNKVNFNTLQ